MGNWSLKIETQVGIFRTSKITSYWMLTVNGNKQTTGQKFMYWRMATNKNYYTG